MKSDQPAQYKPSMISYTKPWEHCCNDMHNQVRDQFVYFELRTKSYGIPKIINKVDSFTMIKYCPWCKDDLIDLTEKG